MYLKKKYLKMMFYEFYQKNLKKTEKFIYVFCIKKIRTSEF